MDWEVITGWEKRIKVDYGSIGPNHVRWSDWTYKERDIVARKVHQITFIQDEHGPQGRLAEEWAKENAPIMIGFARDGKPMPDWAHADYRPSGVPEHVQVVWKRERPDDLASPADWAYDPPGPWEEGEEPAWSARPLLENGREFFKPAKIIGLETEGSLDPKFGGVVSYKTRPNGDHVATDGTVISTKESRATEDIPQWRKFEIGRLEILDNVVIPGPRALPKDARQYGENIKLTKRHKIEASQPTKIMPNDPDFTAVEKALNWAAETRHGPEHQVRWNRVAAALGEDNGFEPLTLDEVNELWNRFNRNPRWTMARDALNELEGVEQAEEPEGEWRLHFGDVAYGKIPPAPGSTGWYTRRAEWLPDWYWDLPAITDEEAKEQGATNRAGVAPLHFIYHKKGTGILGRQKRAPEREDLPIWTKDQAAAYYLRKGIKMRSRQWLDGHLMQQPGYTDNGQGHGTFVARAADEAYEASHKSIPVPNAMAEAIAAGDWATVAKLAAEKAGT